jgi:endonuclease YncB( thermonuclease family)
MHRKSNGIHAVCGLILAALGPVPAQAASLPECAGGVEISRAKVVRVEQNGVLVLSDGRALILEGIRLPMGAADHAPVRLADEARATLLTLARDGAVTGTAIPPKQDRYDRVRVQGFTASKSSDATWLQRALLEQGLARVALSPDRGECAADLYRFEAAARKAGRGLWTVPAYRVRTDRDDWRPDVGSFQVIEGNVGRVTTRDGATVLDLGNDGRSGLAVSIAGGDRRGFRGLDFDGLRGRRLRVRGIVQDSSGRPMIALSNAAQIEVLDR